MTTKDRTDAEQIDVRLDRADVTLTEDGKAVAIPVVLDDDGQPIRGCVTMNMDDAARIHAQLDRLLSRGWALSEKSKVDRQNGETYPVSGSGHLR